MFKSVQIGRSALIAAICAATAAAVILAVSAQALGAVKKQGGSTEARERFAAEYGWHLDGEMLSENTVILGGESDTISEGYSRLLAAQHMDIGGYIGRPVNMCMYEVLNFMSEAGAVMTLFEYNGHIIAAHISTSDGCIYGLDGQKMQL